MRTSRAIGLILVAAALVGLVAGWRVARLSESDLIARAGAEFAALGGDPATCIALPEPFPAWVSVICGPGQGAQGRLYQFNRIGQMQVLPLADPAEAAEVEPEA